MKASIVDLRKNMKNISKALARNERVMLTSHGVSIAEIVPIAMSRSVPYQEVKRHPFFGSVTHTEKSVSELMDDMRRNRFDAF